MVDAFSNMYAPLLPLLMPRLGMSLQAAGTLMMVFQAAASLSQLAFGRLADRGHARALLVAGPLVSATVLSLMGLVQRQAVLAVVLVCGGLGVAAFHPPGAMVAHTAGRARPGTAMSVFVTSGSIGFALSPLLVANAAGRYGLGATVWFLLPGVACALLFARAVPALPLAPHRPHGGGLRALRPQARNLFLLYLLVVLRTVVSLSFATFVPVLLTRQGMSVGEAGTAMALYLFMSGVGGFWGGRLSDSFGPRRVIVWSLLLATPFLLTAPQTQGWTFAGLLAIGGLFLQSTLPVNVSFGQALAPAQRGDRLVPDDGRGVGIGRHARAGHRHGGRCARAADDADHPCRAAAVCRRAGHAIARGATSADARRARRGERGGDRSLRRRRREDERARRASLAIAACAVHWRRGPFAVQPRVVPVRAWAGDARRQGPAHRQRCVVPGAGRACLR